MMYPHVALRRRISQLKGFPVGLVHVLLVLDSIFLFLFSPIYLVFRFGTLEEFMMHVTPFTVLLLYSGALWVLLFLLKCMPSTKVVVWPLLVGLHCYLIFHLYVLWGLWMVYGF